MSPARPKLSRVAWCAVAALALTGCVQYAPAPLDPARYPATLEASRLEDKPAGATWTRGELLAVALARNPRIAAARAKSVTALAAARTARLGPGLTLSLTAEYANESPRWGYGAAADAPLDIGARRGARITTADLQALQSSYDLAEAMWAVRTALAKALVDHQSASVEAKLAERVVALRGERLARLDRRVAAGEDDRVLQIAAQGELGAAERRLADIRGREDQARVALAAALGVSASTVRDLDTTPDDPTRDVAALPALRRDAALGRADVLRAIADYDIAENALRLEVARQYPEVRISPGYTYDHGVAKLPLGVSLTLPAYDLNRRAIDQAEAARAAAGRDLEATQAAALAAVDTAAAALASSEASTERLSQHDLPAARRAAENTARSVRTGEGDRVDDLAAQAAALDAELNLNEARRAERSAVVDLEEALRHAFDPAEDAALKAALTGPGDAR